MFIRLLRLSHREEKGWVIKKDPPPLPALPKHTRSLQRLCVFINNEVKGFHAKTSKHALTSLKAF